MRAGNLDKSITIQHSTRVRGEGGNSIYIWEDLVTLRAEIVQANTEEFIRGWGASDETLIIFRTRWIEGIRNSDRIVFDGRNHDIKELKGLGRRRGLEIRTVGLTT